MGSLFDGIGGFPLAAIHNGVIPLWVSEIEPFPIRVTQQRLPWISSAAAARVRTCPWLEREPDYLAPALAFLWNRSGW